MNLFSRHVYPSEAYFTRQRMAMVEKQLRRRGINDERVLEAMRVIPRHLFVPGLHQKSAYRDKPLPIGHGQTISQPFVVAYMLEQLSLHETDRVLEIGSGCGYVTALLSSLAEQVFSMEILPDIAALARRNLEALHCENIHLKIGDGYKGWPEEAPFDAIVVSAAAPTLPSQLIDQLAVAGRAVLPIGEKSQRIVVIIRMLSHLDTSYKIPVQFVPMTSDKN